VEGKARIMMLYAICTGFIGINVILIIEGLYYFMLLPALIAMVLLLIYRADTLLLAVVALTPFAFRQEIEGFGVSVNLPTEPLIVGLMLLFFFSLAQKSIIDKDVFCHPITLLLVGNLVWIFVTSITSEIPFVSFKFFLSRLWYVVVFFFMTVVLFKNFEKVRKFLYFYGVPLALMVLYFSFLHMQWGFDRKAGIWLVRPFFGDHTNYASTLALVLPFFGLMMLNKNLGKYLRIVAGVLTALFAMGILLSFSRASWLSVAVAVGVFVLIILKTPRRAIIAGALVLAGLLFTFQTQIQFALERNPYQSSGNIAEHVRSIANISTDPSNMERINRWRAALELYKERPVVGWGPGTYQFVYAPFQRSQDFTVITTHFGTMGNAHSEYLGPLAESGLPGMVLFIGLAVFTLNTGWRLSIRAPSKEIRQIATGLTLGFVTYFVHGLLNNFLDTDKASVPFWSMMAILVALDVYHKKRSIQPTDLPQDKFQNTDQEV